jgi:hypothetical protein
MLCLSIETADVPEPGIAGLSISNICLAGRLLACRIDRTVEFAE